MAKIEISNLSKAYHAHGGGSAVRRSRTSKFLALQGIDLYANEYEFLSIIGPSGCGKTTLLKILAGLLPRTSGDICIDGSPVVGPRRGSSMVFQHIGLLPWRTVEANVLLGIELQYHRRPNAPEKARTRQYLKQLGLGGFESYYPYQLSGGMQQRVGIARALVVEPDVLLMDEPFGALDAQTRLVLQDELLKICDLYKATVVFVTHDIEEAIYLSDRVAVMSSRPGRIKRIVDVPFPRNRSGGDIRSDPKFTELRRSLWDDLRLEAVEETLV